MPVLMLHTYRNLLAGGCGLVHGSVQLSNVVV